jgi:thiamine-monophosphate kinase
MEMEPLLLVAEGIQDRFSGFGVQVMGGNISADRSFSVEITLLGEVPHGQALRRSTARVGDDVYVTGIPGSAALALMLLQKAPVESSSITAVLKRWRDPQPPVELSQKLLGIASAAIDVSDGLLADAGHIAQLSHVDIEIEEALLPTHSDLDTSAHFVQTTFESIRFRPSDDYEFLFTAPTSQRQTIAQFFSQGLHRIGHVTAGNGKIWLIGVGGTKNTTLQEGWDHFLEYME